MEMSYVVCECSAHEDFPLEIFEVSEERALENGTASENFFADEEDEEVPTRESFLTGRG